MKVTKKLLVLLLSVVMVFALAVPVFADDATYTITVKNTSTNLKMEGITYYAYKVFDVTLSGYDENGENPTNYAYTVNANFAGFKYKYTDLDGNIIEKSGKDLIALVGTFRNRSDKLNDFAKQVMEYATTNNITATASATAEDDATQVTINVDTAGYYLVTATANSEDTSALLTAFCALDTTNNSAEVNLKVDAPTVEKEVKEAGDNEYAKYADASIGETLNYRLTVTIPEYADYYDTYKYIVHDTMGAGLTLVEDSIKVYINEELTLELDATDYLEYDPFDHPGETIPVTIYTVTTGDDITTGDDCTFELEFANDFIHGNPGRPYYITYNATVNKDAVIYAESNDNSAHVEYSNDPYDETKTTTTTDSVVKLYTYSFDLKKYYLDGENEVALAGAEFKLYSDEDCTTEIPLVKVSDTEYRVATADETGVAIISVAGQMVIQGLDKGTYYLKETKAPSGYNLLDEAVKVTITPTDNGTETTPATAVTAVNVYQADDTTNAIDYIGIENKSGSKLPFTGGTGTMIFYIVGSVLVVGAVVLLITQKRVSNKKSDNNEN